MANQVAYGFISLENVFARRVSEVGAQTVMTAVQRSIEEHNRQMDALLRLFATPTTDFQIRYKTPTSARLQPIDEVGRARPIRPGGYYDVAFPIQMGGAAWGQDFVTKAKMTVEEANEATIALMSADIRWMRDHLLAALFASSNWTFTDEDHGSLTIKGLANGDTDTYQLITGADAGAVDTHYLAQSSAIDNSNNPYDNIHAELSEHPDNGGEVVALIPTNQRAATEALSLFVPVTDPNVQSGANTDRLTGALGVPVPGEVIGYVNKVWIVEWRSLPDDYLVAVTADGERPLKLRQDEESELQGFKLVGQRDDHPFYESQWARRAGFGANNRVGALAYRIGNASWAVPTGYGSPMA